MVEIIKVKNKINFMPSDRLPTQDSRFKHNPFRDITGSELEKVLGPTGFNLEDEVDLQSILSNINAGTISKVMEYKPDDNSESIFTVLVRFNGEDLATQGQITLGLEHLVKPQAVE